MFTNKKYPCIFYSFQTYFCCQSRLRMHLVSHFKMKSAIIMVLLALVAVTQANKAGMNNNNNNNNNKKFITRLFHANMIKSAYGNNIYGCINRVFTAQKYIYNST